MRFFKLGTIGDSITSQFVPTEVAHVGLIGTLLCYTTLEWLAPLLEKKSPLLENFEAFVKEFQASFGDNDSTRMTK